MSYDDNNDIYSDKIIEDDNNITKSNKDISNITENVAFKSEDDDFMIKEMEVVKESRVSYFGIYSDTKFSAIINLTSSAIGGGCLNFPAIITSIGLPLTIVIFLFVSLSIYYTINLLRYFVVDTKLFSFALMTNEILGKKWLKIYAICSLIFYISIEIHYLDMIYTIVSQMIVLNGEYEPILNLAYFAISITIEIFICSYIAKTKRTHLFSLISSFFFIIVLIIIIMQGIKNLISGKRHFEKEILFGDQIENKMQFCLRIMTFIIEYLYGYSYHSSYPTLLKNLRIVDDQNTKIVNIISFIYIFITYFLVTFFGYFTIHPVSAIIEKPIGQKIVVIIIFRIVLCLFILSVIPLRFIVIRDNYSSLIRRNERKKKISFKRDLIHVIIILLFCNLIVFLKTRAIIFLNNGMTIITIFGGIFGVIIGFILPVINYIGANGKTKVKSIIGYVLAGIFSVIGLLSVGYSIFEQINLNNKTKN